MGVAFEKKAILLIDSSYSYIKHKYSSGAQP